MAHQIKAEILPQVPVAPDCHYFGHGVTYGRKHFFRFFSLLPGIFSLWQKFLFLRFQQTFFWGEFSSRLKVYFFFRQCLAGWLVGWAVATNVKMTIFRSKNRKIRKMAFPLPFLYFPADFCVWGLYKSVFASSLIVISLDKSLECVVFCQYAKIHILPLFENRPKKGVPDNIFLKIKIKHCLHYWHHNLSKF